VNRLTRILPLAAAFLCATLIVGCTHDLTAPSDPSFAVAPPEPTLETDLVLTPCRAQPYAAASGWIGPGGGSLKAGKHALQVPAGALSAPVFITMEVPSSSINRVVLRPAGLTFNTRYPARLIMSYANCAVDGGAPQQIVNVTKQLIIIEATPSETDPLTLKVNGSLLQVADYALSTYAVVY
jgi:hypothetical protein